MARNRVTAQDMASRLMGAGTTSAPTPAPKPKSEVDSPERAAIPSPAPGEKKPAHPTKKSGGTKRLNLNITVQQWRKLKRYAMDRDMSVSDVIRGCIDAL